MTLILLIFFPGVIIKSVSSWSLEFNGITYLLKPHVNTYFHLPKLKITKYGLIGKLCITSYIISKWQTEMQIEHTVYLIPNLVKISSHSRNLKLKLKNSWSWIDRTQWIPSFKKCVCVCVCVTVYIIKNILKDMQKDETKSNAWQGVYVNMSTHPPKTQLPPRHVFLLPRRTSHLPTLQQPWGSSLTPHSHHLLTWPVSEPVSHNFKPISWLVVLMSVSSSSFFFFYIFLVTCTLPD